MLSEPQAEELIRDALRTQADRAPSSYDLLAGLDSSWSRRHEYRRGLVTLGAVTAVVLLLAVVLPLTVHRAPHQTTAAQPVSRAMDYRVTWVPPGWATSGRVLQSQGNVLWAQRWAPDPFNYTRDYSVNLTFARLNPKDAYPDATDWTSAENAAGQVYEGTIDTSTKVKSAGDPMIVWSPKPGVELALDVHRIIETPTQHTADMATLHRMQQSVVFDPNLTTNLPFTFGFIPDHAATSVSVDSWVSVGDDIGGWLGGGKGGLYAEDSAQASVSWGPGPKSGFHLTTGNVRVRDGYGDYVSFPTPIDASGDLFPPFNVTVTRLITSFDGGFLQAMVVAPKAVSKADMVRMVNEMTFYPNADESWLGKP